MIKNNDVLTGLYNYFDNEGKYSRTIKNSTTNEYVDVEDIIDYKYKLFNECDYNIEPLEIMEQLNDNSDTKFVYSSGFLPYLKDFKTLLVNQKTLMNIISSGSFPLNYKIIVGDGMEITNKKIKVYLLPKERECSYFVNFDNDGNVISYKKVVLR